MEFLRADIYECCAELDFYSLVEIFQYLSLYELVIFGMKNVYFVDAISKIYEKKFMKKTVILNECCGEYNNARKLRMYNKIGMLQDYEDHYMVYGKELCSDFIQFFGKHIEHLVINFEDGMNVQNDMKNLYANMGQVIDGKMHMENLKTISFNWLTTQFEGFDGVFPNVHTVRFSAAAANTIKLPWINKHFPNVENVNFSGVSNELGHQVSLSI